MRLTWKTLLILGTLTLLICVSCSRVNVRVQPPSIPATLKASAGNEEPTKDVTVTEDKGGVTIGPDVNLFCNDQVQGILFEPIPCEPRECNYLHPENCHNLL